MQFYRIMEARVHVLRGHQLHACLRACAISNPNVLSFAPTKLHVVGLHLIE